MALPLPAQRQLEQKQLEPQRPELKWLRKARAKAFGDSLNCEVKLGNSAEPLSNNKTRNILRIRTDILNFEPELSLKLGQTKHKISGNVPTSTGV